MRELWTIPVLLVIAVFGTARAQQCVEDCQPDFNGNGMVEINELVRGVKLALEDCPGATPAEALEINRKKWSSRGVQRYRFVYNVSCYCRLEHPLVILGVEDGNIVSTHDLWTGETVNDAPVGFYRTIEDMFDLIGDAIQRPAYRVQVNYEPDTGAPLSLFIDYDERIADDEIGIAVTNLQLLALKADQEFNTPR